MVDQFGLDNLFRREILPSEQELTRQINTNKEFLPTGVTSNYLAKAILSNMSQPDCDTIAWNDAYSGLNEQLDKIPAGKKDAYKYHDHVYELLKATFEDVLSNPHKEQKTDNGLGKIDITFDNDKKIGFFKYLHDRGVLCEYIPFECKNYASDIGNTQFDQINSRLNKREKKEFGVMVCRAINDAKKCIDHCKTFLKNDKYIIVLSDEDIKKLFNYRKSGKIQSVHNHLKRKIRELEF